MMKNLEFKIEIQKLNFLNTVNATDQQKYTTDIEYLQKVNVSNCPV